jgi:hypothetical protein
MINIMLRLHVPIFKRNGHVELSKKKSQFPKEMGVLEKHNTKANFLE